MKRTTRGSSPTFSSFARAWPSLRPTTFGTTPCSARGTTSITRSYEDSVPFAGYCASTTLSRCPGLRGLVDVRRRQRLRHERLQRAPDGVADDARNLDLVRLAVRALGRNAQRTRASRSRGSGRCRAPACPSRSATRSRRPVHRGRLLEVLDLVSAGNSRELQRLLHERLPDQRRERAAGDRIAVELRRHRDELVRIADPDRRHELRRVADEPRVAVVRRSSPSCPPRAGRRALARRPVPWVTTRSRIEFSTATVSARRTRFPFARLQMTCRSAHSRPADVLPPTARIARG